MNKELPMTYHDPKTGELIVHWTAECVWHALAAGALLALLLTSVLLGAALLEPSWNLAHDWLTGRL
jgi:hypothetical protein